MSILGSGKSYPYWPANYSNRTAQAINSLTFTNGSSLTWIPALVGGVGGANLIDEKTNPFTKFNDGFNAILQLDVSIIAVVVNPGVSTATYSSFKIDLVDGADTNIIYGTSYFELVAGIPALSAQNIVNKGTIPMVINSSTIHKSNTISLIFTFVGVSSTVWATVTSIASDTSVNITGISF
jgi:hypothetical protein